MKANWRMELVLLAAALLITSERGLAQGRERQDPGSQSSPPVTQTGPDRPSPEVLVAPNEDYRIAPGDTIDVQVQDALELSITARVSASGSFEMPFLGVIKAQGKTLNELASLIADQLRQQDYLKQPQVRVLIRQYNSQTFFIHGAVRSPGVYMVEGRPTLIKLISVAGGLAENHGSTALIMRPTEPPARSGPANASAQAPPSGQTARTPQSSETAAPEHAAHPAEAAEAANSGQTAQAAPSGAASEPAPAALPAAARTPEGTESGQYELIKANISAIYEGRFEQNVKIEPGDIVYVPPANVFFVAGEVNAPGSFRLKEGTTLRQAISLAQGTTFKAKLGRGVIFRDNPKSGKRDEIHVDIADVMSGKKDDLPILPNDVIIVPNSRAKSVSSSLLSALGISAATRVPGRY